MELTHIALPMDAKHALAALKGQLSETGIAAASALHMHAHAGDGHGAKSRAAYLVDFARPDAPMDMLTPSRVLIEDAELGAEASVLRLAPEHRIPLERALATLTETPR